MITIYDEDYALGKPYCNISKHSNRQGLVDYVFGGYHYKNGTVIIFQQGYLDSTKIVALSLCRNGRCYYRTIKGKIYTDIGLARKAGEFARQVDLNNNTVKKDMSKETAEEFFIKEWGYGFTRATLHEDAGLLEMSMREIYETMEKYAKLVSGEQKNSII